MTAPSNRRRRDPFFMWQVPKRADIKGDDFLLRLFGYLPPWGTVADIGVSCQTGASDQM